MPRGEHLKGKGGVKFSATNQPTPESKSVPKRLTTVKNAVEYFGSQLRSVINIENEQVELTFETNIVYQLYKKANEGDLNAIKLIMQVIPDFMAPTKQDVTLMRGADELFFHE